MDLLYVLLLGIAVSFDSFGAGVSYGLKNIRVPYSSLAVVAVITAICTILATLCAGMLGHFFSFRLAMIISSLLLIGLGLLNLLKEYLVKAVPTGESRAADPAWQLSFRGGKILVSIIIQPEKADLDHSQSISLWEALFLGLALGLDNMVAVFAASLAAPLPLYTPVLMGAVQAVFIAAGSLAGCHLIADSWKNKFVYLPGVLLIIIGLARLR